MQTRTIHAAVIALALLGLTSVQAATVGTELIVNGNAETGNTSGWISSGITALSTASWYADGGVFNSSLGTWIFAGGEGPLSQSLTQTVDISNLASVIDAGGLTANFAAAIQSPCSVFGCDSATATVQFLNQSQTSLLNIELVDPHTSVNIFDFNNVSFAQLIPSGTRSISVVLNTTRFEGTSSDGTFDNVSLSVSTVPEPYALAMMSLGIPAIWLISRRRMKARA